MGLVALLVGAAVGVLAIGAVLPADVAMGLGSGISRSLSLVGVLVIVLSVRLGLDRGRRRLVRAGGVIAR